jgi:hypothetical protein
VKKQETFSQLIDRLADLSGLDWMRQDGVCLTKDMAIYDVLEHRRNCHDVGEWHLENCARAALEELDKFDIGSANFDTLDNSQHYVFSVDWGDAEEIISDFARAEEIFSRPDETPSLCWQPTEQDCRECCGMWVGRDGYVKKYSLSGLRCFESRDDFDRFHEDDVRIEPMPEQCIPKDDPEKESYHLKYPLLAGILK